MIYRSDIRLKLYKKGYEALLQYYKTQQFDYYLIQPNHAKHIGNHTILIALDYFPIQKNDMDMHNLYMGLQHLKDHQLSYHLIRIGEDDEDTEEEVFTAEADVPLFLQYPVFSLDPKEGDMQ